MLLYIQCIATWWKNQTRVQSNLAKNCIADLSPLANVNGFFALNTHLIQSSLDSRTVMDKLQHVLNAAAHVVTGTWKSDRGLSQIMHDELHWLDVPDRVFFKLAVTVNEWPRCRTTAFWLPVSTLNSTCVPPTVNCLQSSLPAQHLQRSGLFSCWPYNLELSPRFHPGSDHQGRLFQKFA